MSYSTNGTIDVKSLIVGYDQKVPTLSGEIKRYINFDNAASTPTFKPVLEAINAFMPFYSSIHRGTGFKSQLSTQVYDETREIVLRYCHADPQNHTVVYGKNTTEMVNKVARRLITRDDQVIITTRMEHHSNDLPWRYNQKNVVHVAVDELGRLDLNDFEQKLKENAGKVRLVAVSGASNVTGFVNPIYQIARLAHQYDAEILVDAAQLAPHRALDIKPQNDESHIDFLVFSAHKIYAPFGQGALIADKSFLAQGMPDHVGGGVVDVVDDDYVYWTAPPEKEEAGTPNIVGALALAKALQVMEQIGLDYVAEHERRLTSYALKRMKEIDDITFYGSNDENDVENRLGVITFNLGQIYHGLLAAILTYEYAVGVRNGCFCAHSYLKKLMRITPEENKAFEERVLKGDRSQIPGAVRMSFGLYNSEDEIDVFIEALKNIKQNKIQGTYVQNPATGEFKPEGFQFDFSGYFTL